LDHPLSHQPDQPPEIPRGLRYQPRQGRRQRRSVSGRAALEPSRQIKSLAARRQPDPPTAAIGAPSPRRRGPTHRPDQSFKSPAKTVFPSGFGPLRGGSVAAPGQGGPAQMAHPPKPKESPQRIPQTVLLPPGLPQPNAHRATTGTQRQSGATDRRVGFAPDLDATFARSFSSRVSTNTPRNRSCTVDGQRPTMGSRETKDAATTQPCGRWPTNGSGSSGSAGRLAPFTRRRSTRRL